MKKNWKKIATKLGKTKILLSRLIGSMSGVADVKVAGDMKRFFRKSKTPGVDRAVAQTVEKIRINSRLLERIRKEY